MEESYVARTIGEVLGAVALAAALFPSLTADHPTNNDHFDCLSCNAAASCALRALG
jgi:hypothetical protein